MRPTRSLTLQWRRPKRLCTQPPPVRGIPVILGWCGAPIPAGRAHGGSSRWEEATLHLRSFQEPAIQQVTRQCDIGFIALLLILTSWADTGFLNGLVKGPPCSIGFAPPFSAAASGAHHPARWQGQCFLAVEDATNAFCTPPMRGAGFLSYITGQAHRLIPRCVITQSSGKQRVIDNGAVSRCQQAGTMQSTATSATHQLSHAPMVRR